MTLNVWSTVHLWDETSTIIITSLLQKNSTLNIYWQSPQSAADALRRCRAHCSNVETTAKKLNIFTHSKQQILLYRYSLASHICDYKYRLRHVLKHIWCAFFYIANYNQFQYFLPITNGSLSVTIYTWNFHVTSFLLINFAISCSIRNTSVRKLQKMCKNLVSCITF